MDTEIVRIIVSGKRSFNNYELFEKIVNGFFNMFYNKAKEVHTEFQDDKEYNEWFKNHFKYEIITGMAVGTDLLAIKYCHLNSDRVKLVPFEPKFWIHGEVAGEIRNREMALYATQSETNCLIAFDDDSTNSGTKNMIEIANNYNIPVYTYHIKEEDKKSDET